MIGYCVRPENVQIFRKFFLLTRRLCQVPLNTLHRFAFRYPKWSHTFENQLSLEFRTRQSDALLLYTDDGGVQGNFYALTIADGRLQLDFRLGDESNDLASQRAVVTMRVDDIPVNDNRWHQLTLFQAWENVKLQLDDTVLFKILSQQSFVFGNLKTCSDVFVGGVPKDIHMLAAMSSPLKRHTKTFAGTIKNLVYRLYPQGVTSPQLLESVGMRQSDDDYCKPSAVGGNKEQYCKNDGVCYSTNDGPKCDCSLSDFDGRRCEQGIEHMFTSSYNDHICMADFSVRLDAELSFFGNEWLGYDVSNNSAATIRSRFENISFAFKTIQGRQTLFFSGDQLVVSFFRVQNYVYVTIDDGSLVATSKFDDTEKRLIRIFNEYPSGRYDDDQWHMVTVTRTLTLMTLIVDGRKDEIRQYAPEIDWLKNSYAFVGGIPLEKQYEDLDKPNFRGCMKKVKFEADAHLINFISLADQGYGQSVIRSAGDLAFSCRKPTVPPDILSFNSGQHYITLPKWNSLGSGSIGFQLRTYELDGLILYHGSKSITNDSSDYIAFELIDGHLFLIINLGSGHVRLQTTASKITEGTVWHSVTLERMGRTGTVIVDNIRTDFSTPGVSANLIIDEPIYVGAVPWPANDSTPSSFRFPSTVWTANLRQGYVGCLKNVRLNGISANIANVYEEQKTLVEAGISQGCPNTLNNDYCASSPCKNYGRCEIGYATFRCDCSNSHMEGPTCNIEPEVVELTEKGGELPPFHLPNPLHSESETIECKFRTDDDKGIIFDSKSTASPSHRILIAIIRGELELHLNFGVTQHTFNWGSGLNDDRFHSIRVKRRGEKLLLFLDGKWEHSYFLPSSNIVLQIDQIAAGHSLHPTGLSDFVPPRNETNDENFSGQMIKLTFNGYDVLKKAKRRNGNFAASSKSSEVRDGQKSRNRKAKYSAVSFETNKGRVVFADSRISTIEGPYRISLKFRTLAPSCIILVVTSNSTYSFGFGSRFESVLSPVLRRKQTLSDMRWHSLLIYQNAINGEHHMIIDNTSTVMDTVGGHMAKLEGQLYLGGVPPLTPLSPRLTNVVGFRGCISSLRIGDEHLDAFEDAYEIVGVTKGCTGQ
ncbi:unnamed protein product [Anisakis simplex]|uniref:Neurexin-1a n=1 Tax=Anisakis simplex TaxID=6269 RepID=A0A158PPP0_ANISI|nr:unnamed protein product [Anisakis simplex]